MPFLSILLYVIFAFLVRFHYNPCEGGDALCPT